MSISIATEFTPFEYLLISIANAAGKDKLVFEDRIEWCLQNSRNLHKMIDQVDDKHLFYRGVLELDNIRKGVQTGYMLGLDGTASGLQCLAALSGCHSTANQVNLVNPLERKDPYTGLANYMNKYLHPSMQIQLTSSNEYDGFTRNDLKSPLMTHYYGSVATPEKIFGTSTAHLKAFYRALEKMNPGAEDLMRDFMGAIDNENRTHYGWIMPDGFDVRCNVIAEREESVEIDELMNGNGNKSTITHMFKFIGRNEKYVAITANATHSVDSLVVREMHRRMNFDRTKLAKAYEIVQDCKITTRSDFVSLRMADWILEGKTNFTDSQCGQLAELIEKVTQFQPAPLVTVHDEFKTYPAHCGQMRYHYREIFAEIADSNLATSMLRDIYEDQSIWFSKHSEDLSSKIRQSKYAIC